MLFFPQVGVISKEVMLYEPLGTRLADSGPQGGSDSPTTAAPAGTRAARYSPLGDATSTMPLGRASEAASASHMPQGVPQLQERQETVFTPQGVTETSLTDLPRDYQVCQQHCVARRCMCRRCAVATAVWSPCKRVAKDHIAACG